MTASDFYSTRPGLAEVDTFEQVEVRSEDVFVNNLYAGTPITVEAPRLAATIDVSSGLPKMDRTSWSWNQNLSLLL